MTEETIFANALEKETPAERSAFLHQACGGDLALRQRVEALLRTHDQAGNFMERPAVEQLAAVPPAKLKDPAATQAESLQYLQPPDKPGSLGRLGHYDVQAIVGHGGMGVVLKAFDDKLHRVVAIKVMAVEWAANATARQRFIREARAAAAICHEHVVTIHAVEEDHRPPYLVMQFVEGVSLQEKLDRGGPLGVKEILRIGIQTADGLAAAHQQGLVHRDVKPANILLENGVERVKITDFGLARVADDARLTQSGVIAGTPEYMSPEQADGQSVDHRSDLFSLGSVLYACCTGRSPFRASSTAAALRRVCDDTPRPIREINPEIPEWLCDVIAKLHAKHPADRFQSAGDVADLLGRHLAHLQQPSQVPLPPPVRQPQTVEAAASTPAKATKSRLSVLVVALVVLLVLGICLVPTVGVGAMFAWAFFRSAPHLSPQSDSPEPDSFLTQGMQSDVTRAPTQPGGPVPVTREPFVIVSRIGNGDWPFATLSDAVAGAQPGDAVEIRGNGPFVCEPVTIDKALTIRAGGGFRPVLLLSSGGQAAQKPLLTAKGPLVLEGLDLEILDAPPVKTSDQENTQTLVRVEGMSLHALNCRFGMKRLDGTPYALLCVAANTNNSTAVEMRNCARLGSGQFLGLGRLAPQAQVGLENCLVAGDGPAVGCYVAPDLGAQFFTRITLRHSTLALASSRAFLLSFDPTQAIFDPQKVSCQVESTGNVFVGPPLTVIQLGDKDVKPLPIGECQKQLRRLVSWWEKENLYVVPTGTDFFWMETDAVGEVRSSLRDMRTWEQFWDLGDTRSYQQSVQFKKDLPRNYKGDAVPEDFRLTGERPAIGPATNRQDFGATIDFVGPGAAYERFKQTPGYKQWLKDSGQVR
jgi:serine/threonine protein kinase